MTPYSTSAPNRYCRLFPPNPTGASVAVGGQLEQLAWSMASDDPSIPIQDVQPQGFIPAAYTYFGQFIDHDLTYDTSNVPAPPNVIEPEDTTNNRKSFLNLDNLYGEGPVSQGSKALYEDDGVFFKLGAALSNGRSFDVPLGSECGPMAADPRNIENAIVRQIHAMFLQLHNIAVEEIPSYRPAAQRFTEACERVRHQFQWLVRHDFLPRVCNEATIRKMESSKSPLIDWGEAPFSIPVEFAQAAFRFGHSMVRDGYDLGNGTSAKLKDLFGGAGSRGALPTKLAVNWDEFCAQPGSNPQFAHPIDTSIVRDLYQVPTPSIQVFVAALARGGEERVLPLRTLRRGDGSRLCSGQVAHGQICPMPYIKPPSDHYMPGKNPFDRLDGCGLRHATPLWYYILMEAELNEAGNRLADLGSFIVAGTVEGALRSNPSCCLHEGATWSPPPWRARDGSRVPIKSLHDVARVVGLA